MTPSPRDAALVYTRTGWTMSASEQLHALAGYGNRTAALGEWAAAFAGRVVGAVHDWDRDAVEFVLGDLTGEQRTALIVALAAMVDSNANANTLLERHAGIRRRHGPVTKKQREAARRSVARINSRRVRTAERKAS